ncbi:hemoblobin-interacting domain-containing protein [Sporosarcina sp. FA9]|uniref:hemoblobin-interacting domain-containing protein n=1 Tax=Sporosarcina sp. FA9 TaxID=3413030 RepID=UPI003F65944B
MKKKSLGFLEQSKSGFSKLSLLMAFTLAFSILPVGALAEEGTTEPIISVPPVIVPPMLIMPEPTVTPVVTPIEMNGEDNAGDSTENIDNTVVDDVVDPVDAVGALNGNLELQGGAMVTLAKTKFTGISGTNTFWATSGEELAQSNPGTDATLSSLNSTYTINISVNPFVPASVGQTISVIEVNGSDEIVGFGTFTVENDTEIGTNEPPIAKMSIISVPTGGQYWHYVSNLFTDPEGTQMYISNIVSSNASILAVLYSYDYYFYLYGVTAGTATISFEVRDETGDKIEHTLNVIVAPGAPNLYFSGDMPFTNIPVSLTFYPNSSEWFNAITSVEVNNVVIQPENYTLTEEKEFSDEDGTWTDDEILFDAGVLKEGENRIVVKAEGYAFATYTLYLHKAEESFYTSPLTINKTNGGITATFKSLYNFDNDSYWEQATAIFQLMNGNVPISTVSFTIDELDSYQSFKAQFSLFDATTNPNYSVRAFLITGDNADNSFLGHNLSTEVTQEEFDALYQESRNG